MAQYQFVIPKAPGNTLLAFTIEKTDYSIQTDVPFCEALILTDRDEAYVFQSNKKSVCDYVGRAFSLGGVKLFDIPFPDLGQSYPNVHCYYSWASLSNNVIKMVFHTDSVSYGDFWADYNLLTRQYVAVGPSR